MYMPRLSRRTRRTRRRGGGIGEWFATMKNKITGSTASAQNADASGTGMFGAPSTPAQNAASGTGMFGAPSTPAPAIGGRSRRLRRRKRGGSKCSGLR
jgi:hypothetical protein